MNEEKLNSLEQMEAQGAQNGLAPHDPVTHNIRQEQSNSEQPNLMDGYVRVDKDSMPHGGRLYPDSWEFAYRCPTAKEVAAFSTVIETDQPAIVSVTEDLIRKCVIIFDTARQQTISTGHLNDSDRTYFLLLLRDQYLPNNPIRINTICQTCKETFEAELSASTLQYRELKERLIESFDGRNFELSMPSGNTIKFHMTTLDISSRIFKFIVKAYRNNNNQDKKSEVDNIAFDKTFLLLAPYLFKSGSESIKEIVSTYKFVKKNEALFKDYLEIATFIKLDNLDTFESVCPHCGSLEETQVTFPGGIKNLFTGSASASGYF